MARRSTSTSRSSTADKGGDGAPDKSGVAIEKAEKAPKVLTPREARDEAQARFDKADEEGKAEIIGDNQRRGAALGY